MRTKLIIAMCFLVLAITPPVRSQQPNSPPAQPPPPPPNTGGVDLAPLPKQAAVVELPKMAGTWTITTGERDGQRLPDERLAGMRVTITADRMTIFERNNKPFYVVNYKLDSTRSPNEINMEVADGPKRGQVARGIIMMDCADIMRLNYSIGSQGRPAEFRTMPGGTTDTLFILKRHPTPTGAGESAPSGTPRGGVPVPPKPGRQ